MNAFRVATSIIAFVVISTSAWSADLPGSKDPPGFKRFQGSQIVHYGAAGYSEYKLGRGNDWSKSVPIEGNLTRVVYLEPVGASSLEVFRNYQQMLAALGFQQTFEFKGDQMDQQFFARFEELAESDNDPYYGCGQYGSFPSYYTTYKANRDGQDVNVALFVGQSNGCPWGNPDFRNPVSVSRGQTVVGLDVIAPQAVQDKMVIVKAVDIADALASKGVFDLYGVYFDTDKTDVKAESTPTLDEVATLLKIDRSLRLEVSGHTDNTGRKDHNLKLSQGRAQAVVAFLVSHYGIDPKRLVAKGYGDTKPVASNNNDADKAKNRRVELRKL